MLWSVQGKWHFAGSLTLLVLTVSLTSVVCHHSMSLSMYSCRQQNLRKVLKAYAMYNIKTGYCQVCIYQHVFGACVCIPCCQHACVTLCMPPGHGPCGSYPAHAHDAGGKALRTGQLAIPLTLPSSHCRKLSGYWCRSVSSFSLATTVLAW